MHEHTPSGFTVPVVLALFGQVKHAPFGNTVLVALLQAQLPPVAVDFHVNPLPHPHSDVPFGLPVPPFVVGHLKQTPLIKILVAELQPDDEHEAPFQVKVALHAQEVGLAANPFEFASALHEVHFPPTKTE